MTIEDTIYIEAPIRLVWDVTEDVERWPEWSPTVTTVRRLDEGAFRVGSAARIKQPLQPAAEWIVTDHRDGAQFTWESQRPGLRLIASHRVRRSGSGSNSTLWVKASGFLAILLWPLIHLAIRRSVQLENRSLKARCEEETDGSPDQA